MFRAHSLSCPALLAALVLSLQPLTAHAGGPITLLDETFGDNPIGTRATVNGANRYTYSGGSVTAAYNTDLATSRLEWSLGQTLTDSESFCLTVDFSIASTGFVATLDEFAQIEFALINSATTGTDRPGGTFDDAQGAFDLVGFTYFPNLSSFFDATSLLPTAIGSDPSAAPGDYFGAINAPFNAEDNITNEGPLPLDVPLTAVINYDATSRTLTLSVAANGVPLAINTVGDGGFGGPDGDPTTIENTVSVSRPFALDTFAIPLWFDTFNQGNGTSVAADVTFERVLVETPEPASLALLAVGAVGLVRRRRLG